MKIKPIALDKSNPPTITNGFTLEKSYIVIREEGNGYVVRNDNGHERFVCMDGKPSPHLLISNGRPWPFCSQYCAGMFVYTN